MTWNIEDGSVIAFTVVETSYLVGTDTRAALGALAWPLKGDVIPIPVDAEFVHLYATQDCWVRFLDSDLYVGMLAGTFTLGLPTQHFIPLNTEFRIPAKVMRLYVVRDTVNGNLYASFFAE